jgi:hypothetical protein
MFPVVETGYLVQTLLQFLKDIQFHEWLTCILIQIK